MTVLLMLNVNPRRAASPVHAILGMKGTVEIVKVNH